MIIKYIKEIISELKNDFSITDYNLTFPAEMYKNNVSLFFTANSEEHILMRYSKAVLIYIYYIVESLRSAKCNKISINKNWVYCISKNNYDSTKFLINEENILVVPELQGKKNKFLIGEKNKHTISVRYNLFELNVKFPIIYIHCLLKQFNLCLNYPDIILRNITICNVWKNIVKLHKPRKIIFSNDHYFLARSLLYVCNQEDIYTMYIQHACVSKYFPKLDFNISFLDGMHSFEQYNKPKKCEITGSQKLFSLNKIRRHKPSKDTLIGVSLKPFDNINYVKKLIDVLEENKHDFLIRPHPAGINLVKKYGRKFISDPNEENIEQYLNKISVNICGDSTIALESAYVNIPTIIYNMTDYKFIDYYGFIVNDIANYGENLNDVTKYLTEISNSFDSLYFDKCKLYDHSLISNKEPRKLIEKYV